MNKLIVLLVVALGTTVAAAQPAGSAAAPAPAAAAPAAAQPDAAALRKTCTDAMNADPSFATSILQTVDVQIETKTLEAHKKAAEQVAENQRHVILAYAAMWVLAALFVVFLWRRQQVLKAEIANLRRDLDAAAKESGS